jgi:hypothetical protein
MSSITYAIAAIAFGDVGDIFSASTFGPWQPYVEKGVTLFEYHYGHATYRERSSGYSFEVRRNPQLNATVYIHDVTRPGRAVNRNVNATKLGPGQPATLLSTGITAQRRLTEVVGRPQIQLKLIERDSQLYLLVRSLDRSEKEDAIRLRELRGLRKDVLWKRQLRFASRNPCFDAAG